LPYQPDPAEPSRATTAPVPVHIQNLDNFCQPKIKNFHRVDTAAMKYAANNRRASQSASNKQVAGLLTIEGLSRKHDWCSPNQTAIIAFLLYLVIGISYYTVDQGVFTPLESLYFSITTLMTIGYGDVHPGYKNLEFSIVYILLGVGVVGAFVGALIVSIMDEQEQSMAHQMVSIRRKIDKISNNSNNSDNMNDGSSRDESIKNDIDELAHIDNQMYANELQEIRIKTAYNIGMLLIVIFVGAAIMGRLEGWNYKASVYWSVVTCLTIGFGDYYPQSKPGKIFMIFFALIGCSLTAKAFAELVRAPFTLRMKKYEVQVSRQFSECLNPAVFKAILKNDFFDRIPNLRKDSGNVQKCEFVIMLLQMMGKLQDKDVLFAAKVFDRLDVHSVGYLNEDEVNKQIAEAQERQKIELEKQRQAELENSDPSKMFTNAMLGAGSSVFALGTDMVSLTGAIGGSVFDFGMNLGGSVLKVVSNNSNNSPDSNNKFDDNAVVNPMQQSEKKSSSRKSSVLVPTSEVDDDIEDGDSSMRTPYNPVQTNVYSSAKRSIISDLHADEYGSDVESEQITPKPIKK